MTSVRQHLRLSEVPEAVRPALTGAADVSRTLQMPVYVVGGCVRDWLLGLPGLDVDLVVEGDGLRFAGALAEAVSAVCRQHEAFGTATLECSGELRVDVATARTERYKHDGSYPSVSAGTVEQDLARRDFSINAIAARLGRDELELLDPFGGRQDLASRTLRALHDRSFFDDPTRALRGVRFAVRFGMTFDPRTEQWMRAALREGVMERVQRGRIRKELELIGREPDPWRCLQLMASLMT